MQQAGTADKTALAKVPPVTDTKPFNPTQAQITAAKAVVTKKWAAAVALSDPDPVSSRIA